MSYRITVDTGGTFTDMVVASDAGRQVIGKAPTTPERIFHGMKDALDTAADELGVAPEQLLAEASVLIYGTTRATNAIVQGKVAKTAFLTTQGFPDTLVLKEGGKHGPHDFTQDFPDPYIPQKYTFEIPERIDAEGGVRTPLDEAAAREIVTRLKAHNFEAIAVCLMWSIMNPGHEQAVGRMIEEILPGVPYTLSHELVPIIREYRRASATAIDASLKPLMQEHLRQMESDLRGAGYKGEILVSTAVGGCMHVEELAARPIHTVKSGPAMAPVAGLNYARIEEFGSDVIICDAGGTTFDVGLVRDGEVKFTRDTWIGPQWTGHILAISSVDVRSIGAGGGSIAWIDPGGLLRVGPHSAGAVPGPACYGAGGDQPTVTDAALVLGYLDAQYFLGGRMALDMAAARKVIETIAEGIGGSIEEAAYAIMSLASEYMIKAIHDITVTEGFNPAESALVAGGGAAGLNIMTIADELGCKRVILPKTASALSACGMQFSDIIAEHSASKVTLSGNFNYDGVNQALEAIDDELGRFVKTLESRGLEDSSIEYFLEARYLFQVWELDVPISIHRFRDQKDVDALVAAFHDVHERVFAVRDVESQVECLNWKGRARVRLAHPPEQAVGADVSGDNKPVAERAAYFGPIGRIDTPIYHGNELSHGALITGPAIIEEPTTTLVVNPGMSARLSGADNYLLETEAN
ncbi:MAG: hydantoinase/oxoprolinase family protein [Alphaproteobacteria bacterium]|jgi:N-methylhydantoinase A|nr:hydantoinase/oxoprolinase family protein [Alphaproteobacteria bacterium]MDP6588647.1 hydantoinase/oxoprolinase family protein [Alphaproteobacteria bacterium]MDP6816972.1 hydantoinase/oxoprolinase family protein [Alphaproteobacteria bacterium]